MPWEEEGAKVSQLGETEPKHPSDFKRTTWITFSATASGSLRYQSRILMTHRSFITRLWVALCCLPVEFDLFQNCGHFCRGRHPSMLEARWKSRPSRNDEA